MVSTHTLHQRKRREDLRSQVPHLGKDSYTEPLSVPAVRQQQSCAGGVTSCKREQQPEVPKGSVSDRSRGLVPQGWAASALPGSGDAV